MPDPVGTALASIAAGATTGAAIITAGVGALRLAQSRSDTPLSLDTGFAILSVTLLLGIVAAVASGWSLARTIGDTWRRGVIAALSVFGASLLALAATAADLLAGRVGLAAYCTGLVGATIYARAVARRTAAS